MTTELDELYQEVILENSKNPRNFGRVSQPTCSADGKNPLCGDQLTVSLTTSGDTISDIKFEGAGCAISVASASLMSEYVKGKSKDDALKLFNEFQGVVTGTIALESASKELGDLLALAGVKNYPIRVKCATLAWHTLKAALEGEKETSTE